MKSYPSLIKQLDEVFSRYIRLRNTDEGLVRCFTSGKLLHYKDAQCGHFISRSHMATRYDEINCQVQSREENEFKSGNLGVFYVKLVEKYGDETVKNLLETKHKLVKFSKFELEEKIKEYKEKVKKIL